MGTDADKKEDETKELPKVGFTQLVSTYSMVTVTVSNRTFQFRYATGYDMFLIIVALLTASEVGISQPAMMIIFGDMTDSFVDAGKFAICNNKTSTFNKYICELTISTASADMQAAFR